MKNFIYIYIYIYIYDIFIHMYIYIKQYVYKSYKSHSIKCSFTNPKNIHVEHVKLVIKSPKLL